MTEDEKKKCDVCGVELHWSPLVEGLPQMKATSDCGHVVRFDVLAKQRRRIRRAQISLGKRSKQSRVAE